MNEILIAMVLGLFVGPLVFFILFDIFTNVFRGAPYVPAPKKKIAIMRRFANIQSGERVYDLGSGEGNILEALCEEGVRCTGVELNPLLYWKSKRRFAHKNYVQIVRGDIRTYPITDADVVFVYLTVHGNKMLQQHLERDLQPGARVVSNGFEFKGWIPEAEEEQVYLYRMP